ncbi:MAG: type II toxin-antitoxin system VapC family toxin [Deltaproteobacteria bacterium]|nr:type II toxin-antitoxin system VapC family toxin [Deltaproteobacteria bacterium]
MKKKDVCIDANVFVASLLPEPARDPCLELIRRLEREERAFYEPAHVTFEVVSTLHKKLAAGDIEAADADRAIETFYALPVLLQSDSPMLKHATQFAHQLRLKTIYDGAYLAVAAVRDIPLITLDGELRNKGRTIHGAIFTVDEFLIRASAQ